MTISITRRGQAQRANRLILLAATFVMHSTAAQAQAPMVFVHGLRSDGSTWGTFPTDISASVPVIGRAPNLPSFDYYTAQSSQLSMALPSLFNQMPLGHLIAVGHSNGGIVSRELAKTQPIQP